jgi:hypothetical protein
MKETIDIIIYFIVVIVSFILGRCYQIGKEECKRVNKIGYNPSPNSKKPEWIPRQGYQPNKIREPLYEPPKLPKPPSTGSGIR